LQWASAALQSDRQSGDLLTMTMRRAERITALLDHQFGKRDRAVSCLEVIASRRGERHA
jgi:hypothetical protein